MTTNNRNVPKGTRDLLFEETALLNELRGKLSDLYKNSGFSEIITPSFEYYDTFKTSEILSEEQLYKFTDLEGKLLVLRADNTTPIARVASTRLANERLPIKLFYHQPIYRHSQNNTGKRSETMQSGVEILGSSGLQSDLLSLIYAAETLEALGGDYKLELGHVGFYNALIAEYDLDNHQSKEIRKLVENKDANKIFGLQKIAKIPFLFGGEEIFAEAEALAGENREALDVIKYLRRLHSALCEAGYGDKIMIDFGIVNTLDYYTGVVFKGYMQQAASSILSGGRYDNLLSRFGKDIGAVGFGVNMSEVVDTIIKTDCSIMKNRKTTLVCFDSHSLRQALEYVNANAEAELSPINGKNENEKYARENNYKKLVIFEDKQKTEKTI